LPSFPSVEIPIPSGKMALEIRFRAGVSRLLRGLVGVRGKPRYLGSYKKLILNRR